MDLSEAGDLPGALKKSHGSDMQRLGNSVVAMAHGNDDAPECYLAI